MTYRPGLARYAPRDDTECVTPLLRTKRCRQFSHLRQCRSPDERSDIRGVSIGGKPAPGYRFAHLGYKKIYFVTSPRDVTVMSIPS
jgi:hypothetical protein